MPIFGSMHVLNIVRDISFLKPIVPCKQSVTMASMVNKSEWYAVQNMSHKYWLKVSEFHYDSLSGLRTVEESSVRGHNVLPRPDRVDVLNQKLHM